MDRGLEGRVRGRRGQRAREVLNINIARGGQWNKIVGSLVSSICMAIPLDVHFGSVAEEYLRLSLRMQRHLLTQLRLILLSTVRLFAASACSCTAVLNYLTPAYVRLAGVGGRIIPTLKLGVTMTTVE